MKRAYEPPKVRRHGDLARLTRGAPGGQSTDGAVSYRYETGGDGGSTGS